ncbi:MAG TPA: 2-succinyl-5-enolpyruvyl-6-hydroxy-3-cyclohexene-1-carboxylic-acid synthase, partial [Cryomorphaceae bacterium]|nr:2-succinyl-5-enolpyruvyl-6-hydroxy-3-cyclohexene-1-carboxylic-acid synthase [Cryomorphaceae bacterium]
MTSSKPIADWILDGLKIMGVDSIIFSPGSRNAPFIIAASARIDFKLRVVLDERSAAFQALGE